MIHRPPYGEKLAGIAKLPEKERVVHKGTLELVQTQEGIIVSDASLPPADEVGDNSSVEGQNDTHDAALGAVETPRGTGGGAQQPEPIAWDDLTDFKKVRARFVSITAARLKPGSQDDYWWSFERFARHAEIESLTPRQLKARGRDLLIDFAANGVGRESMATVMAGVKKVWRKGLELDWPIDKDDLPRPGEPRIVEGPRRADVERWVQAARDEKNVYERAWFFIELTYGLRPVNQQAAIRREHVIYDVAGKPLGIVAKGFKTGAYVVAAFPPDVSEAVGQWLKTHPDASPEAPLFPRRSVTGRVEPSRQHSEATIGTMRRRFANRNGLPHISSKGMRKFVKGVLIDAGMPEPYKGWWQGHKPKMSDMDVRYGAKAWEEVFPSQLRYLPSGPMGIFATVGVAQKDAIPKELVRLWERYQAGEIDRLGFANELQTLKRTAEYVRP